MLDESRVIAVLELHEKSYALLRWVKASLRDGRLSFTVAHRAGDAEAAEEWIGRHLAGIPVDARPDRSELPTFARLFASFLTTSFRLNANGMRRVSVCGCRCSFCSYLQAGPSLDPRTPSKRDFARAIELKRIYLTALAGEWGLATPREAVDAVLGQTELREAVSTATWGRELLRRAEFGSQGEAVLALWREFAWSGQHPRPDFKPTSRSLCEAERQLLTAIVVGTRA